MDASESREFLIYKKAESELTVEMELNTRKTTTTQRRQEEEKKVCVWQKEKKTTTKR